MNLRNKRIIVLFVFISIVLNVYLFIKLQSENEKKSNMYILSLELADEIRQVYIDKKNEEKILQFSKLMDAIKKLETGDTGAVGEIAILIDE